MQLDFVNVNGRYEVEFLAEKDFNLHIERAEVPSYLEVFQRGSETGKFATVRGVDNLNNLEVVDCDFILGVSPKQIKIVCDQKPTMAVVTFSA